MVKFNIGGKSLILGLNILISWSMICGCASSPQQDITPSPLTASKLAYEQEVDKLNLWQSQLEKQEYLKVTNEISEFLKNSPLPAHWFGIQFTLGRAKEGLEDWDGAIQTYQGIVSRSTDRQLEYVALGFYRLAYCYEVVLKNEKALAALNDAAALSSYLPIEISLAEIPARIASVYSRLNQPALADRYTQKAEKGILQVKGIRKKSNPEALSRTLVNMGTPSLVHLDDESFLQTVRTLQRNQKYLIQAIELGHKIWAPEAQKTLLYSYNQLWQFIQNYRTPTTQDWETDFVAETQHRTDFLSLYLEAIENLKTYQAPEESSLYIKTADVFYQVKSIEKMAVALLETEMLKRPRNNSSLRSTASVSPPGSTSFNDEPIDESQPLPLKVLPEDFPPKGSHGLPRKLPKKRLK